MVQSPMRRAAELDPLRDPAEIWVPPCLRDCSAGRDENRIAGGLSSPLRLMTIATLPEALWGHKTNPEVDIPKDGT